MIRQSCKARPDAGPLRKIVESRDVGRVRYDSINRVTHVTYKAVSFTSLSSSVESRNVAENPSSPADSSSEGKAPWERMGRFPGSPVVGWEGSGVSNVI